MLFSPLVVCGCTGPPTDAQVWRHGSRSGEAAAPDERLRQNRQVAVARTVRELRWVEGEILDGVKLDRQAMIRKRT